MDKIANYLIIVLLGLLLVLGIMNTCSYRKEAPKDNYKEQLELITSKIDSLSSKKDSIEIKIVTVDKEIKTNKVIHEKVVNDIIHQSSSVDSIFAIEYIKKFIDERLSND